jgi:hypothetical protein
MAGFAGFFYLPEEFSLSLQHLHKHPAHNFYPFRLRYIQDFWQL